MSNKEFLILGAKRIPFIPLKNTTFWVSEPLIHQVGKWIPLLSRFPRMSRDIWIVSSVVTSMDGTQRPGTSHVNIGACDLAPIRSWGTPFKDNGMSGLLYNNRLFTDKLLTLVPRIPIANYVEQDHLHLGFTNDPGVYFYKDYGKYKGDSGLVGQDARGDILQLVADGSTRAISVSTIAIPYYRSNPLTSNLLIR